MTESNTSSSKYNNKAIDYSLRRSSYNNFFKSKESGLSQIIKKIFPIHGSSKNTKIVLDDYLIQIPYYDEFIYMQRYLSYLAKIKLKITTYIGNNKSTSQITYTNIPIMINDAYFMINGTKKVMIYQLAKTGGIYYDVDNDSRMVNAKLVSTSGSRIELRINHRESINVYINNSKKILLPDFFKLFSDQKIAQYIGVYNKENEYVLNKSFNNLTKYMLIFGKIFDVKISNKKLFITTNKDNLNKYIFAKDNNIASYNPKTQLFEVEVENFESCFAISKVNVGKLPKKVGPILENTIINSDLITLISDISEESLEIEFQAIFFERRFGVVMNSFLRYINKSDNEKESEEDENIDLDNKKESEEDEDYDDESSPYVDEKNDEYMTSENNYLNLEYVIDDNVRKNINKLLEIVYSSKSDKMTEEDIFNFIKFFAINTSKTYVPKQNYDKLEYKKIKRAEDFVANIIIRSVERLSANAKCVVIDKNNKSNIDDFINSYSASNEIRKIFSSHPLVQFLDQVNPLAEFSHRRRVSIFNLVNVEKYQVSLEGRDVNSSYYGRLCTAETPEGTNIGLINSFACFAQIDHYGFITSRFYVVKNCKLTGEIVDLRPNEEEDHYISPYKHKIEKNKIDICRYNGEFIEEDSSKITLMEYARNCIFSISASLIPYPQHNDAKRILMGSNMLRQAVPLVKKEQTIVVTGFEGIAASISEYSIKAPEDVVIMYASSKVVAYMIKDTGEVKISTGALYPKTNMKTYNNSTCNILNNAHVKKGTPIIDGYGIKSGELACGNNILVAFMSLDGYNFEDSVVINERLIRDGFYESIHAFEIDVKAKEIDVNIVEKITKDNPNEEINKLEYLDNDGVIKVGTHVKPGTIIASRVVPIENKSTAEDYVLSIIFGKKISDYKDISHKAGFDAYGTVISVRKFNRNTPARNTQNTFINDKHNILVCSRLKSIIAYAGVNLDIKESDEYMKQIKFIYKDDVDLVNKFIKYVKKNYKTDVYKSLNNIYNEKIEEIEKDRKDLDATLAIKYGQNIDNNVSEHIRVLVASRRVIGEGDKVAGRHGNKGVIASVKPIEDMPFLDDGTPIDATLNAIGIPNRLNIGQILETYLGYFSYKFTKDMGLLFKTGQVSKVKEKIKKFMQINYHSNKDLKEEDIFLKIQSNEYIALKSSAFESIKIDDIRNAIKSCTIDDNKHDGCLRLRSGDTGKHIIRKVFIGLKSIMKLIHMAIDKISSRETGGYSTILQQPLPRKVNSGGQRKGEMEMWALEAHGAGNYINEALGPKSDDRVASNMMYEGIINNDFRLFRFLNSTVNVIIKYMNGGLMYPRFFMYDKT